MSDLYVEQAGQGSPVVLVHEGIADSRMWEPQWAAYAERYRVVRFDMRGFGQSPPAVGTFSLAGDLVELLEGLELGPATLIGVSLGGRHCDGDGDRSPGPRVAARPRCARLAGLRDE